MKYSMPVRVRYSETNSKGETDLFQILDYCQDCCIFHSEYLGYTVKSELDKGRGWFLLAWNLDIDRFPVMGEYLQVTTESYKMKSFYGYRRFTITDESQKEIVRGDTIWILMDLHKMLPVRVPKDMAEAYIADVEDDKIRVKRKLSDKGDWMLKRDIWVNSHYLDSNSHVNNAFYAMWAEELLPEESVVVSAKIDYRQSSFDGDHIFIDTIEEEGTLRVRFRNQEDVMLALIELKYLNCEKAFQDEASEK